MMPRRSHASAACRSVRAGRAVLCMHPSQRRPQPSRCRVSPYPAASPWVKTVLPGSASRISCHPAGFILLHSAPKLQTHESKTRKAS
jgi:hypothetical protein